VQSSVQSGDTTLLTSSRATYTAGRTSRDDRNDLAKNDLQSAIQSGSARGASDVATGNTALWSAQGVTSSQGVRSQLAGDAAQGAVRVRLSWGGGAAGGLCVFGALFSVPPGRRPRAAAAFCRLFFSTAHDTRTD